MNTMMLFEALKKLVDEGCDLSSGSVKFSIINKDSLISLIGTANMITIDESGNVDIIHRDDYSPNKIYIIES